MPDSPRTHEELIDENASLRKRIQQLEHSDSGRRRAEEEARQSQALLRAIAEGTSDAIYVKDTRGRYLMFNSAASRFVGRPAEDVLGKDDTALFAPDEARQVMDIDRRVLGSDGPQTFEEYVTTAGVARTFLSTKGPVHDAGGAVTGLFGIARDITERKRAEEALRESESRLRRAHQAAGLGNWEWDLTTNQLYWAEENYRIHGIDPQSVTPSYDAFLGVVDPAEHQFVNDAVAEALSGRSAFEIDYTVIRPDNGERRIIHSVADVVRDGGGRALKMVGTVQDVTERRRADEDLAKLQKAVESSGEVIFLTDRDGVFAYVNPAFTKVYGFAAAEVVGQATPRILKSGVMRSRAYEAFWKALLGGHVVQGELVNKAKDGRLINIDSSSNPVVDDRGDIIAFLCVQRDITERKRADVEKAALEGQLQQAQKMETVGRLAGGVAHDFNNMLGVILGHTDMAMEQVNSGHPLYLDLKEIHAAATRSAALTRQLLAFARKQTVAPKVLDLNDTVEGMLTMLGRLIGEDVRLAWQPGADLWPVKVDPSQVDQILTNLLVNARDAITGVGTVTIETGNTALDEEYCADHQGFHPGAYVRLVVSDDGCGMDKDTQAHLFEPYFTTKGIGKGTGLGLATVYGIVKQNDGFINVYSEPGHGTTFTIYLPQCQGGVSRPRGVGAAGPSLRGHETIMLVEDEPSMLALATAMLERQGYIVLAASTPGEAIRVATDYPGEIHLLMTDVVMPEMNGRDLAKNLLLLFPEVKRLFMSGYPANVIAHHGVLDEGVPFIQKPFTARDLAAAVRETLDIAR